MNFIDPADAALLGQTRPMAIFFRLDTPTPLRVCAGLNDIPIGLPGVDGGGAVYKASGLFQACPDLDLLLNGQAERMDFFVSGVSAQALAALDEADPEVRGCAFHVGLAPLDDHWQPLTQIIPLARGIADRWAIAQQPVPGGQFITRMARLSVGFGETGRSRPRGLTWTAAVHRADFSDDGFFDRMPRYNGYYQVEWPRF